MRDIGRLRILILPETCHTEFGLKVDVREVKLRLCVDQVDYGVAVVAATLWLVVRCEGADDLDHTEIMNNDWNTTLYWESKEQKCVEWMI